MTLDRSASKELERPIGSREDLIEYFRSGEKPPERWRVGTEHEKLSVLLDSSGPVPYEGDRGVEALLRLIAEAPDWKPIFEDGRLIGLDGKTNGISLEPGAQVELNGTPVHTIHQTCAELHEHMELMRRVAQPFGIAWLGLGVHPLVRTEDLPQVPRERYRIMRRYLPTRGELALDMMHASASVQVSFDFSSEADLVDKMRCALAVTPMVSALFANSSIVAGRPSEFVSKRLHIWRHTDPDRTGLLPFVFEPGFGYERYAEWALDVPMFFILRDSSYLAMEGKTFRRFLSEGHEGERATLADWDRHLTTLFPEVRVKRIMEVRCADAVPPDLLCTVPALWKGLLYDVEARAAATALASAWSAADRDAAQDAVARRGLAAQTPSGPILPLARQLVGIAREGLGRLAARHRDERSFLDPLLELVERGKSPGQIVLERWQGDWAGSVDRLIEHARY